MESLRPIRWRVPPDRRQAAESDRGLVCTPVKATMPALRSTHSIGRPASSQALRREWAVPALLSSHHASYVRADIGNVEPRTRSVSGIDFFTVPHEDSRFVFSTPQLLTGDSEVRSIPTARAREDRWRARAPGHHAASTAPTVWLMQRRPLPGVKTREVSVPVPHAKPTAEREECTTRNGFADRLPAARRHRDPDDAEWCRTPSDLAHAIEHLVGHGERYERVRRTAEVDTRTGYHAGEPFARVLHPS